MQAASRTVGGIAGASVQRALGQASSQAQFFGAGGTSGEAGVQIGQAAAATDSRLGILGQVTRNAGLLTSAVGAIPFFGEQTGFAQTAGAAKDTQSRVLAITEDIARHGGEVTPGLRADLVSFYGEQEKRAQQERFAVRDAVNNQLSDFAPEGSTAEAILETLNAIRSALEAISGSSGGTG